MTKLLKIDNEIAATEDLANRTNSNDTYNACMAKLRNLYRQREALCN